MSAPKFSEEEKAASMKVVTDAGFPPLGCFNMQECGTKLLELFVKKEVLINSTPTTFINDLDRQIIYCVVSSANNCEICLSFHAGALMKDSYIPASDVEKLVAGGLPDDEKAQRIAIATKYAIAHKGILLEREKKHLEALGVSKEEYAEILFFSGLIHANNMFMVHLVSEGAPIEDMLKAMGPFKNTVYKA
eukprot:g3585.t1